MTNGFVTVAAASPVIQQNDIESSTATIMNIINAADAAGAELLVLPKFGAVEMGSDFSIDPSAIGKRSLETLMEYCPCTKGKLPVIVFGIPFVYMDRMFECAAVVHDGSILGIVPKSFRDNHHFSRGRLIESGTNITINNNVIPFNSKLIFSCRQSSRFSFGVEISSDLFAFEQPSATLARNGAFLIANPFEPMVTVRPGAFVTSQVSAAADRLIAAYVLSSSRSKLPEENVNSLIYVKNHLAAASRPEDPQGLITAKIDLNELAAERERYSHIISPKNNIRVVYFSQN